VTGALSVGRELRASLLSGFLLLAAIAVIVAPDPDSSLCVDANEPISHVSETSVATSSDTCTQAEALATWFSHRPELYDLSRIAGGVVLLLLLATAAYLLGLATAAIGARLFQATSLPREVSSNNFRALFWSEGPGDSGLGRSSDDSEDSEGLYEEVPRTSGWRRAAAAVRWINPASWWGIRRLTKADTDATTEVSVQLDEKVRELLEEVDDGRVERLRQQSRRYGLGHAVVTARYKWETRQLKGSDREIDETDVLASPRDFFPELIRAECKSPHIDEPLIWTQPSLYGIVDRHRSDALLKAALPLPCLFLGITLLASASLSVPTLPALGIGAVLFFSLWMLGWQALRTRQRWQRIIMRGVIQEELKTPTLNSLEKLRKPTAVG
jgi:hypothetical protein